LSLAFSARSLGTAFLPHPESLDLIVGGICCGLDSCDGMVDAVVSLMAAGARARCGEVAGDGAGPTVPSVVLPCRLGQPASMLGFERSLRPGCRGSGAVPGGFTGGGRGARLEEGPVGTPARAAGAEGGPFVSALII
jgi:hypothetical protein